MNAVAIHLVLVDKYIVLMGWENIGAVVGIKKVLLSGEILNACSVFPLACDINEMDDITDVKLVIKDYYSKQTKHKLKNQDKWLKTNNELGLIVDRKFTTDEKGEIIWN